MLQPCTLLLSTQDWFCLPSRIVSLSPIIFKHQVAFVVRTEHGFYLRSDESGFAEIWPRFVGEWRAWKACLIWYMKAASDTHGQCVEHRDGANHLAGILTWSNILHGVEKRWMTPTCWALLLFWGKVCVKMSFGRGYKQRSLVCRHANRSHTHIQDHMVYVRVGWIRETPQ